MYVRMYNIGYPNIKLLGNLIFFCVFLKIYIKIINSEIVNKNLYLQIYKYLIFCYSCTFYNYKVYFTSEIILKLSSFSTVRSILSHSFNTVCHEI